MAALATQLEIFPAEATHALVFAAIISITLNPLLYKGIDPLTRWLGAKGVGRSGGAAAADVLDEGEEGAYRVIVVGHGPVGRTLSRILRNTGIQVVVVEMNIETVQRLRKTGRNAIFGDASRREILRAAGIETAKSLIISSPSVPARPIVEAAHALNPNIHILTAAMYLGESEALHASGAHAVFSSEGEIALSMTAFLMREIGATDEQIDRERERIREEYAAASPTSWSDDEALPPVHREVRG